MPAIVWPFGYPCFDAEADPLGMTKRGGGLHPHRARQGAWPGEDILKHAMRNAAMPVVR